MAGPRTGPRGSEAGPDTWDFNVENSQPGIDYQIIAPNVVRFNDGRVMTMQGDRAAMFEGGTMPGTAANFWQQGLASGDVFKHPTLGWLQGDATAQGISNVMAANDNSRKYAGLGMSLMALPLASTVFSSAVGGGEGFGLGQAGASEGLFDLAAGDAFGMGAAGTSEGLFGPGVVTGGGTVTGSGSLLDAVKGLFGGGGGGGGAPSTIKSLFDIASGIYGLSSSKDLGNLAAPGQAAATQLATLAANPAGITSLPGYQELLRQQEEILRRRMAAQGLNLSGSEKARIADLGGLQYLDYYGQEMDRLQRMASGALAPNTASLQLQGNAINRILYSASNLS